MFGCVVSNIGRNIATLISSLFTYFANKDEVWTHPNCIYHKYMYIYKKMKSINLNIYNIIASNTHLTKYIYCYCTPMSFRMSVLQNAFGQLLPPSPLFILCFWSYLCKMGHKGRTPITFLMRIHFFQV